MFVNSQEGGFGAIGILFVISLAMGTLFATTQYLGSNFKAADSMKRTEELDSIRLAIGDSLSCEQTLGLGPTPSLPVACAGPYTLRRRDGKPLFSAMTGWKLATSCANNRLKVTAETTKPDPTLKRIITVSDLLGEERPFCRTFFTSSACPAGKVLAGAASGVPFCVDANNYLYTSTGFYWAKTNGGTDGQWCIVANQFSLSCSCPAGSREVFTTFTSLYRQWTKTVYCGY
jgi:hypothetical protein